MIRQISIVLTALVLALPAWANCKSIDHDGRGYAVCEVALGEDLRLFLRDADGETLGSFDNIETLLRAEGKRLVFAMNAGMYHADRSPVGLYVENGAEQARLVTSEGPGNFGLLPNGVFCFGKDRFAVIETLKFAETQPSCQFASQSGPMLVIDGELHPRFLVDSTSRYIRNGVGVSADGARAFFAISDRTVTFHEFGRLFRDVLKTPNALYFDGKISRLYAPELRRSDFGFSLGPIVGLAAETE